MKVPFLAGVLLGSFSTAGILTYIKRPKNEEESDAAANEKASDDSKKKHNERAEMIFAHGWPSGGITRRQLTNHVLDYDFSRRVPVWVAEHLTSQYLQGEADRQKSHFKADPEIPVEFSAQNSDFRGSGWSRGHMFPAGDNKFSQESMDETFYLSNIVPQNFENNAGFWNRLEMYCRDLTKKYNDVWVTSGPLFLPMSKDGEKIVSYKLIGENDIAVPTHLFKHIIARKDRKVVMSSFIVPNAPIDYSRHLTEFRVTLHELEKKVGYKFTPKLNRDAVGDLCEDEGCRLISKAEMQRYIYTRRIKRAKNLTSIEKLWEEVKEREILIDKELLDTYRERKEVLITKEAEAEKQELKTTSEL